MQISLHRRSRLEGFLGPFFLVQLVFWLQALSASRGITGFMAAQGFTGQPRFWLQGRFWLQLWLQLWLQDFPRTAMFFYKFICFISLVTNVTKKSLKSF